MIPLIGDTYTVVKLLETESRNKGQGLREMEKAGIYCLMGKQFQMGR